MEERDDEHDLGPDAPETPEERVRAQRLREVLEGRPQIGSPEAELARALRAAHDPKDLSPAEHGALVAAALEAARRKRLRVVALVAPAAFAMAAAVTLAVTRPWEHDEPRAESAVSYQAARPHAAASDAATFVVSRSTQPLFDEPFPRQGGATARIDRIARARGDDLRHNRFVRWGVR